MKRILLLICLLAVSVVTAYGQQTVMNAKIPFSFMVGSEMMPAGEYTFQLQSPTDMLVRNTKTGDGAHTAVLTRLSRTSDVKEGTATFDNYEGKSTLEAIWPAGGDGYLLHITKAKHVHKVVKTS
jgi:hypothetical protein